MVKEFAETVRKEVSKRAGFDVGLKEIAKNNGVSLHGLVMKCEEYNLSPTIYVEPYLEMYASGTSVEKIADWIMEAYQNSARSVNLDMGFFRDYERVRKDIYCKTVSTKLNKDQLLHVPHVDFLDLSIVFFYRLVHKELGEASIQINYEHMDMWGCTTEKLFSEAMENTVRREPYIMTDLGDFFRTYKKVPWDDVGNGLWVLTNKSMYYGATCLFYPGVLEETAGLFGEDFYIIPCSVHETLLLPQSIVDDGDVLKYMVYEVNRCCLDPEEILSDSVYYYDRAKRKITILAGHLASAV